MKKVLIVIESESFGARVQKELQKDHEVLLCHDAFKATQLMEQRPDAMVLQMELPGLDGLTFLEHLAYRPPAILAMAAILPPYIAQKFYELGVGYPVLTPCTLAAVTDRLRDMLRDRQLPPDDAQTTAKKTLDRFGYPI